jgi:hypothetical protein
MEIMRKTTRGERLSRKKTTMLQGQANFLDFTFFSAKNDIY